MEKTILKRNVVAMLVLFAALVFAGSGEARLSKGSYKRLPYSGGSSVPYYHRITGEICSDKTDKHSCHHKTTCELCHHGADKDHKGIKTQ